MTPREKILRDELKKLERYFQYNAGELSDYNSSEREHFQEKYGEISIALKQADEIKDGPSEEDREELEGIIYTLNTDGVCGRKDSRWMADKLKGIWG